MKIRHGILFLALWLVFGFGAGAQATVLDFNDNLASPPGFYGYLYYNNYTAGRVMDSSGHKAADLDLSANLGLLKPAYYFKGWDRTFAVLLGLPFGTVRSRNGAGEKESSSGLGDLVVAPGVFLYENNDNGTFLSFWENVSIPTGDWSKSRAERGGPNLGVHAWVLQHQLAFAKLFAKGKVSLDLNLNYYQRFRETSLDVRPGDSFEAEGIAGYGITDKWRAGLYVDYWTDVMDTKVGGTRIDQSKRKFFSMGPSVTYGTDNWAFHLRVVPDLMSENGAKGIQTWLRFTYNF